MLQQMTQVRKSIPICFFTVIFLMVSLPSFAENVHDMERKASSTDTIRDGEPVSFGRLIDGVSDLFGDVGHFFKREKAEKKDERKKEVNAEGKKLIHAKKLDDSDETKGSEKKKIKPYNVYSAPLISETTQQSQRIAPAQERGYRVNLDQPPPLSNEVGLGIGETSPVSSVPKPVRKVKKKASSVQSLPQQYFPILPLGQNSKSEAQLLPVASNINLAGDHRSIRRAIIVIHDITRNATESLAIIETLAGASAQQILIMAPQFPVDVDVMRFSKYLPDSGRQVARWRQDLGWEYGGVSRLSPNKRGISSYTAIDIMLMFLSDKQRFPYLEHVVIAGHGLGADFVQRYAAVGIAPPKLVEHDLSVRFLIANPSSYLYPTASRPILGSQRFETPKNTKCMSYDMFPYGLRNLSVYARRKGASAIRLEYPLVPVTYLVGDKFIVDNYLDRSCAADIQGKDRTKRGINFNRYLSRSYGDATHPHQVFLTVPNIGYDAIGLFGSFCGMISLFGDGACLQ